MPDNDALTVLLNYIHWCGRRGQTVVYGIHVDDAECAPLLAQQPPLIELHRANGGWSNETVVKTSRRGARMIEAGRTPEPVGGAW